MSLVCSVSSVEPIGFNTDIVAGLVVDKANALSASSRQDAHTAMTRG
jgi:hypothetical protein